MRRREFITLLGGAAVAWPLTMPAQQPAMPVIGYLGSETRESEVFRVIPIRQGLQEGGYVEGTNAAFEYRWADGQFDRSRALAADLARRQVSVIVVGGTQAALAAKAATTTIPIVFSIGGDPVQLGLVVSLNRPGGNLAGVTSLNQEVIEKRLELLHETVPAATLMALLVNPASPSQTESTLKDAQAAARRLGLQLHILHASSESDFDLLFADLEQQRARALMIGSDPYFTSKSQQLATLSIRHAVPAISPYREFAAAGGMMSYGTNVTDLNRRVGLLTSRLLKGEKPVDLPVEQAAKLEMVINLKTAKMLGVDVPFGLSAAADEVIE
jgi:putative tryptophan/tyrosine transport system substrate-binding protein